MTRTRTDTASEVQARLREIEARLRAAYGQPRHHNPRDALDDLVFVMLSRMTQEVKYVRTYRTVRQELPGWEGVRDAPEPVLADLLADAGLSATKTWQIQGVLREITAREGRLSLERLRELPDAEAEAYLTSLPGVARKTAGCVLLYALGRDVCPVDTHVWRVLGRLGVAPRHPWSPACAQALEISIPAGIRASLHVTLVAHGRAVCQARRPRCGECVLADLCPSALSEPEGTGTLSAPTGGAIGMDNRTKLVEWLRAACAEYVLEPVAVYRRHGEHGWPLEAADEAELERKLEAGGHFLPLPREPAALANVLEVSLAGFILQRVDSFPGGSARRGGERQYPDVEISGPAFGGGYHALDIKVARRKDARKTQSRITLYTGNTYFRHPTLRWPGTFRPFADYESHLDLIALYTFNPDSLGRIEGIELIVHEAWRIGSRKRSSTTREYIGAVDSIQKLRDGKGDFKSQDEFYAYWRKFRFRAPDAVQRQLDKLLKDQGDT